METALIISADRYEFADEKSGEIRKGITVHYINDYREDTDKAIGFKPIKAPATLEVFEAVRKGSAPALYELDFRTRPGQEGKPTLTIVKADLVRTVEIFKGE
jgi:hypothetical protein